MARRFGTDIGGVLRVSRQGVAMPGVIEGLRLLQRVFGTEMYVVSRCPYDKWIDATRWLDVHLPGFFRPYQVHYCLKREEKAIICREIGITHFVDNQLEVLSYMADVRHRYLFQPTAENIGDFAQHLMQVRTAESWTELSALIAATINR